MLDSSLDIDSIIGGGPQMYHKVSLDTCFSRSFSDILPSDKEKKVGNENRNTNYEVVLQRRTGYRCFKPSFLKNARPA